MFKKGDGYWQKLLRVLVLNFCNFQANTPNLWNCGVIGDRMLELAITLSTAVF